MRRVTTIAAVLIVCAGVSRAQTTTVYSFLRNDVGARAAGLAGSFVTMTNDPNALFYNAASLATLDAPRGSLGYFKHLLDINSGSLTYAQQFEEIGFFGVGVLFTDYGSFTETDAGGASLGSFGATDIALSIAYARPIEENVSIGGAVKFIYSSLAGYGSTGLALDVGALYRFPASNAAVGVSLRNLGAQLGSYAGRSESLPVDLSLGGSIMPKGLPLLLNVELHRLTDDYESFWDRFSEFSVGGEFTISPAVLLRVGYDNARAQDLELGKSSGLAGFSAGLGILIDRYQLDYALSSLGKVGELHRISISARF